MVTTVMSSDGPNCVAASTMVVAGWEIALARSKPKSGLRRRPSPLRAWPARAHTGGAQDDDDGEGKIEAEVAKVRKMKVENADSNVIGTLQCIGCCWAERTKEPQKHLGVGSDGCKNDRYQNDAGLAVAAD